MKYMIVLMVSITILGFQNLVRAEETGTFQVIVHTSTSCSRLTPKEISKLFLKKLTRWEETREPVYPVDLPEESPVREQFSQKIHGKEIAAIKAYWQQQIFSGREIPPLEKASDQEVLEYVAEHAGAIGYVSAAADITEYDVKVIEIGKEPGKDDQ